MSHFYGRLKGNRDESTRCGTAASGMETICASWSGAVRCKAYVEHGVDCIRVEFIPWFGHGESALMFDGPINRYDVPKWEEADQKEEAEAVDASR